MHKHKYAWKCFQESCAQTFFNHLKVKSLTSVKTTLSKSVQEARELFTPEGMCSQCRGSIGSRCLFGEIE